MKVRRSESPDEGNTARFDEAVRYLASFTNYEQLLHKAPSRITFDLGRLERLLDRFGNPERHGHILHVAGTKGKSSVVMMAEALVRNHGCRTFRFLSPHLESVRERLAVNGSPVGATAFADLVDRLRPEVTRLEHEAPGDLPSFFEATTVMGFLLARERDCEAVVLEVGLGGRLDATNVVDPTACLITQIARDHTRILGDTVASIAREKAGIIKPGRPVAALGRPGSAAHKVISERAGELGAPLVCEGQGLTLERTETFIRPDGGPGLRLDGTVAGRRWQALELRAGAEHQAWNALLALHGASLLLDSLGRGIEDSVVRTTLRELNLPARSEWFPGTPPVLLDGAHTQESVMDLTRVAERVAGGRPIHVVCALTRDRDPARVLGLLAECAASLTATTIESPRGRPAAEVAEPLGRPSLTLRTEESPTNALKIATDAAGDHGIVVIAGSLYLAGSLRGLLGAGSRPGGGSQPELPRSIHP